MLKKIGIVLAVIIIVIICLLGAVYFRYQAMVSNVSQQYTNLTQIDLNQIADGVYTGSFGDFLVYVKVAVAVKNHKIEEVKILEQRSSPDHKALDTTGRIVKAQSPKVDAVTGASGSSMAIMIAVERALTRK